MYCPIARCEQGRVEVGELPTVQPTRYRCINCSNLIGNALKFHRDEEPAVVRIIADLEIGSKIGNLADSCQIMLRIMVLGLTKYLDRQRFSTPT